jgi:hypothetical protein
MSLSPGPQPPSPRRSARSSARRVAGEPDALPHSQPQSIPCRGRGRAEPGSAHPRRAARCCLAGDRAAFRGAAAHSHGGVRRGSGSRPRLRIVWTRSPPPWRRAAGSVDATQGTVTEAGNAQADAAADPAVSDILDDLAEAALRTGAEVIVLPADRMPSKTGVAAVFRH